MSTYKSWCCLAALGTLLFVSSTFIRYALTVSYYRLHAHTQYQCHSMSMNSAGQVVKLPSGRSLYVEKHDRQPSASGTPDIPILFIHGMTITSRTWHPLLPYLSDYTCILYDAQGHGRTPPGDNKITVETLTEDTRDVLSHFGYESAYVAAHSAACSNGLSFVQTFPEKAKALILFTPIPYPFPEMMKGWPSIIGTMPTEDMLNTFFLTWLSPASRRNPEIVEVVKAETHAHDDRRAEQAEFHQYGVQPFVLTGLHGVPTWIVQGNDDSIIQPESLPPFCKLVNGKLRAIDGGHYIQNENPEGCAKVLLEAIKA